MRSLFVLLAACGAAFGADFATGQAARLVIGQHTFTAQQVPETPDANTLGGVGGVAYGADTLFVADSNKFGAYPSNNRVLLFTPVSQFPSPTAVPPPSFSPGCTVCIGAASVVVGQTDATGDAQNLTQNGLRTASAVASDGQKLVIADSDNNRVLIWNNIPTSNNQPADVVLGQPDFTHGATAVPPLATSLRGPQGVWIAGGRLFIADTIDNRVLIYNSIPSSNGASPDLVLGQPDFTTLVPPPVTSDVVPATQSNLSSPVSVTTDGTRLYVADLGHNRIMIWNSIPASNNQSADVEIGQKDFVTYTSNDTPDLCPSNGTDVNNNPTYPVLCGTTLSFPRFALSDGQRLFVADGGNDRVLVYNSIPSANTAKADVILGQPDENTDFASANTDSMQTPASLAWDGSNLYVADAFNLRVTVFTPQNIHLPVTAVRNAASLEIYATGSLTLGGTPTKGDEVDLTIGTITYKYTVVANDTLANIVTGLVSQINSATTPDPNVIALANTTAAIVLLTARQAGTAGEGTALSVTTSSGAGVTAAVSGATITINLADASKIAPGSLITINGTSLSEQTASADFNTGTSLPTMLGGVTVYVDGLQAPLTFVSSTQVNAQMPYEIVDRSSVSVYVVTQHASGPPTATTAIGSAIVGANPGLFTAAGGPDPRPGLVYHYSANASGLISVDGSIQSGDVATVTINGRNYTYTVQNSDTLYSVRDALVVLMRDDPDVLATGTNEFTRILLQARVAGSAGDGIAYSETTNVGADLILTAFTSALCCGNASGGLATVDNPTQPSEVVYTYATGLGITNPSAGSYTGVFAKGPYNPLAIPVDSILVGGDSANIISSSLVPGQVGVYQVVFQLPSSSTTNPLTELTIAQQLFVSNIVTFPLTVPPSN